MGRSNDLAIVKRSKAGLGLFATSRIPKGTKIVQYTGEIISDEDEELISGKYLFDLDDEYTIDGRGWDNLGRYVNHSCRPNASAMVINGEAWIIAKRKITEGEEITFDYGQAYFDQHIKPIGCKCVKCDY